MMENEKLKANAIYKAYVKLGTNPLNHEADENGWSNIDHLEMPLRSMNIPKSEIQYHKKMNWWRPKSLQGIEDNNGWICIEPDGSNLPTDESIEFNAYRLILDKNLEVVFEHEYIEKYSCSEIESYFYARLCTHYKPIVKSKPIY